MTTNKRVEYAGSTFDKKFFYTVDDQLWLAPKQAPPALIELALENTSIDDVKKAFNVQSSCTLSDHVYKDAKSSSWKMRLAALLDTDTSLLREVQCTESSMELYTFIEDALKTRLQGTSCSVKRADWRKEHDEDDFLRVRVQFMSFDIDSQLILQNRLQLSFHGGLIAESSFSSELLTDEQLVKNEDEIENAGADELEYYCEVILSMTLIRYCSDTQQQQLLLDDPDFHSLMRTAMAVGTPAGEIFRAYVAESSEKTLKN